MLQLLKDIYSDSVLAPSLAFKGGTAAMFFYGLPRFSTDLDFNLLDKEIEVSVYERIKTIVKKYGSIYDEARKFYGSIIVLDYGIGERKLKIEISNRLFDNHYEVLDYLGIKMKVMVKEDMFAHKLCALLDRSEMTSRDVFDCWFFLKERTPINQGIIESRMQMSMNEYINKCLDKIKELPEKSLINGLGELTEGDIKQFVRHGLKDELISLLGFFRDYPILK